MRVLVTGSGGFLGAEVVRHLVACGYDVLGLSLRTADMAPSTGSPYSAVDLASRSAVDRFARLVEPCEAIVHAAASLSLGLRDSNVARANCVGMQNLLLLQEAWSTRRIIFLSSVPVIGRPLEYPITEEHPVEPLTAYHASKLFGEQLMRLVRAEGAQATTLRLTAPVGPGIPEDRLLSILARSALAGRPLYVNGRGNRRQDYVDLRDVAEAVSLCLKGNPPGLLNIASGRTISNLDLARVCIEVCESPSKIVLGRQDDPGDELNWDVSIEKAHTTIGYRPNYPIDESIRSILPNLLSDDTGRHPRHD